jgi:type I restriction enzyme S subunit
MAGSTFAEVALGDIADFRNGKAISPERYTPAGRHPVFGSNGQIARSDDVLNPQPVIVIGRVGAYCGCVHYVSRASWVTDNAIVALPKDGNDLRYLFYLLGSLGLQRTAIGSAQPLMTQGGLKVVRTKAPPLAEQKVIAEVLGALDDKIELNRLMNVTLEAMAGALFQSWFVDFDPVRAKREGRQPVGIDAETAALFPTAFQDSALGPIPQGWGVKPLGRVIELAYGKPLKAEDRKSGSICVYGSNGPVGCHDEKLVSGPGIVVGRKGNPGVVTWAPGDFFPIDTTFYVLPIGDCRSLYFLYYALSNHSLANLSADSAVPGLNRNHAYMSEQVIPPESVLEVFDSRISPIFAAIHANEQQSRTLATLRDTLLPKLLSGELRVPAAAKLMEARQ